MRFTKKFFQILIFTFIVLISSPAILEAQNCGHTCPSGRICIPNPLKACSFEELINSIIDILFNLAIPLTALMILVAAFYFITAAGKPEQITTAKKIILWTLIGFLVILCAKGIIWFLMEVVFKKAP